MTAGRRRREWMCACEGALLAVAAVAFMWYAGVGIEAAREQSALARELDRASAAVTPSAPAMARRPPVLEPRALVGRIELPRLHLAAFAREGVDARTLRGSVGHVPGTALPGAPGNSAFAAHRDTFFAPLKDVRKGDRITVTTPHGAFDYVVWSTRIVDPDAVSVLDPTSEPTLTLVTCYPFDYFGSAPQRFIVKARMMAARPSP